ncbi:putative peptidase [Paenibacillus phyllosphaerae]|uniref:Putative peptidase n=1 Tax=Paenibacillus phyllosphaerae TaxID=274593 RepID=A0A7W5B5K4_9BACL|nr:dienelactone hydrolase family protein [Paenibacillus phyllosphaerae]MBB3114594.1 putative peptidase [Paenibacillus phyllosphaerae]
MDIRSHYYERKIEKQVRMGYQLLLPDSYADTVDKQWPVILFLHGVNKRGNDLEQLRGYGLPDIARAMKIQDFIIVAPQCPAYSNWPLERDAVLTLLDLLIMEYRIDRSRVYVTGFSMGGHGAWDLAAHYPERFAAAAPLAGWYQPEAAGLLKGMPIWAFHGEEDSTVNVLSMEVMVQALKLAGHKVKTTIFPGLAHNIMQAAYSMPELYAWFLLHRRESGT